MRESVPADERVSCPSRLQEARAGRPAHHRDAAVRVRVAGAPPRGAERGDRPVVFLVRHHSGVAPRTAARHDPCRSGRSARLRGDALPRPAGGDSPVRAGAGPRGCGGFACSTSRPCMRERASRVSARSCPPSGRSAISFPAEPYTRRRRRCDHRRRQGPQPISGRSRGRACSARHPPRQTGSRCPGPRSRPRRPHRRSSVRPRTARRTPPRL